MQKQYDLVIVGGGAAGMLAASVASDLGKSVLLLEKNKQLGVKLLITGKGRCNITNAEEDLKSLIQAFGKNGRFLYSAFQKFSNIDVINFFQEKGLKIKIERGNRVFPLSDKAKDVVNLLIQNLKKVDLRLNTVVKDFVLEINQENKFIRKIILHNNEEISADNFLIATGGMSYPQTGSTGDAYDWLKRMGHHIVTPKPALTPILVEEDIVQQLEGLSLKNVEISLWNEKKIISCFGEALFMRNGLSGPIILDLSNEINNHESEDLKLKIDFKPALDEQKLDLRIRRDFEKQSSKIFKNSLNQLLPKKLIPVFIKLSEINPEKKVAEISKIERKRLLKLFKGLELTVKGLVGFEKAIVTAGGVSLKEVNPKTMKSKIVQNLYLAGEVLDIDGPTGGYNLQVAWSTGALAAHLL